MVIRAALIAGLFLMGCGGGDGGGNNNPSDGGPSDGGSGDGGGGDGGGAVEPTQNWDHDIVSIDIDMDLDNLDATATVVTDSAAVGVSLDIGGLVVTEVRGPSMTPVPLDIVDGRLDLGLPAGRHTFTVSYEFSNKDEFDGWMVDAGVSFLWPTFCGNLYPCVTDPSDGFTMTVNVEGASDDVDLIYPREIPAQAPSYMFAIAAADYETATLGTTANGTVVKVYYPISGEAAALSGTLELVEVFEFFEDTYGDYLYGDEVASVSADWGGGDFGGMEHHPFWHVSSGSMSSKEVHAHEAAHGWYGNGVRIACWEDFVLSEGLATYLAARGLAESDVDLWPDYECELKFVCENANTIVLPDSTCNEINILTHPLWSGAPYMKGAYFLRAVAEEIGETELDTAIASFYDDHKTEAARMQEFIDHVKTSAPESATAIDALVTSWLRTEACPVETGDLCQ